MSRSSHLRIARPTDRLEEIERQYVEGFDGVMPGHAGAGDHLEFTREQGAVAGGAPSAEHLLAFYLPDVSEWTATCADVDGYRVVLANFAWAK